MGYGSIGEAVKAKEVSPAVSEVAIFKQLIKERVHPLELVRELLSNSGAEQVGATRIEISYTQGKEGDVFEITDNGCGMNYTGNTVLPGRLDRFLGLGLSGIVGLASDEFSWKGLGSKLAFQSRRVEIETCAGAPHPMYQVTVNEPWETLNRNNVPRPRLSEHPTEGRGTTVKVLGHPPHRKEPPFTFDQLRTYLLHRTFAGFTRDRKNEPEVIVSVLGRTESIPFGFPEFKLVDFSGLPTEGLKLDVASKTLIVNLTAKGSDGMSVRLKGFLTWDPDRYQLSKENSNVGLILSVRGIPYFNLDMEKYGSTSIRTARPGEVRTCLVVECDAVQDEMNISRSALVDSPKTLELRRLVTGLFQKIESSQVYLRDFRRIPEHEKVEEQGGILAAEKKKIESADQNWVVLERSANDIRVLMREPQNEMEVNAILWKLEGLGALPFHTFETLAYIGASRGPDLLVNFQEDKTCEPHRACIVEVENNFYNYKTHGHTPPQYPKVICWDVPSSGRKAKIDKTAKPYKFTLSTSEYQVHIYALKYMDGLKVISREDLTKRGMSF